MKKILLIIWIALASISVNATEIDERKTDIYFGNGVWNDKVAARAGRLALETFIYLNLNRNETVKLSFNNTNGHRRDLIETFYQLKQIGQISGGYFVMLAKIMTPEIPSILLSKYLKGMVLEEASDLSDMVTNYQNSINAGHKVLLVAHSQGTLFGIRSFNSLNPWQQAYFRQVSVASPGNTVPHGGDWITDAGDLVIKKAIDAVLINNSLDVNAYNSNSSTDISGHKFIPTYLAGNDTSKKITNAISSAISNLNKVSSQYQTNTNCETIVTAKHIEPNSGLTDIKDVFVVSDNGKIFHDGIGYVKANYSDVIDRNNSFSYNTITQNNGIVEVTLSWSDGSIDLDLESEIGKKDVSDICKGLEHYYVATENEVQPGVYKVSVNHSGSVQDNQLPQNVFVNIKAGNSAMSFSFEVTSSDMLNLGHIADIKIDEKKNLDIAQSSSSSGGSASISEPVVKKYNLSNPSEVLKYEYEVISRIKQALLGPLSDAEITLTKAEMFEYNTPFYTSRTTGGEDLLTSGAFYFPSNVLSELENDKYYVVSVNGGKDIDSNDDGNLDSIATYNYGTIHAILSGTELKNETFKVNILTEAAYQVSKEILYTDEINATVIKDKLDNISKRILIKDINEDEVIDYNDLFSWLPRFDKDKLRKSYDDNYQAIVEKIYNNEEIYDETFKIIYEPILEDQRIYISEDVESGSVIAQVVIELTNGDEIYTLSGEGSENFEINADGNISLSASSQIDYETKIWYHLVLNVSNDNFSVNKNLTVIIQNAQEEAILKGFTQYILEDSPSGYYVDGITILTSDSVSEIVLEGEGSENFDVKLNTRYKYAGITVNENAFFDSNTTNQYNLKAYAKNAAGDSSKVDVIINILPKQTISLISEYNTNTYWMQDVALSNDETIIYTVDSSYGLHIIDNSNNNLSLMSNYDIFYFATDIFISSDGQLAYIADDKNGLRVVDISDSYNPILIGEQSFNTNIYKLEITKDENYAFVFSNSSIKYIDISNPSTPVHIGDLLSGKLIRDIKISENGNFVYAINNNKLFIVDISNITVPIIVGEYEVPDGDFSSLVVSKDLQTAYILDESGLYILDISNSSNIFQVSKFNHSFYYPSIRISTDETKVFVRGRHFGLKIIDITNKEEAKIIGLYPNDGTVTNIELSSDETKVYLSTIIYGVIVLDVSAFSN